MEGQIGNTGTYDVEFTGGQLVVKINAARPELGLTGGVHVELGAAAVIDALERAIPGTIPDAILNMVKAALLKI